MDCQFQLGDTFLNPGFRVGETALRQFDYVIANPMWNQKSYNDSFYANDAFKRFEDVVPENSADWAWVQHIWSSLSKQGRAAVVLDTGAISRGSDSKNTNKEKGARKRFIEEDRIEGVILLPDNLFYNTTAPGILLFLNKSKARERKNQIILVNASTYFEKEKPKNVLRMDKDITPVIDVFNQWKNVDGLSKVITVEEACEADYNLSPLQFVVSKMEKKHRNLGDIYQDLNLIKRKSMSCDDCLDVLISKLKILD